MLRVPRWWASAVGTCVPGPSFTRVVLCPSEQQIVLVHLVRVAVSVCVCHHMPLQNQEKHCRMEPMRVCLDVACA